LGVDLEALTPAAARIVDGVDWTVLARGHGWS
jgi:hypothetical protein